MAKSPVTISQGHGFCDDCTDFTYANWVKTQDGNTLSAIVPTNDDIFDIQVTAIGGNNAGYYSYPDEGGASNLALSATAFTKIRGRYKCSGNTKAKVGVVYADTYEQVVLAAINSLVWKTFAVPLLTTHGNVDHIRLYANDAVGHAFYDFVMIYKSDFSLPNTKYGETFTPPGVYADNQAPGSVGAETQNLGGELALVDISCDLDLNVAEWKRSGDVLAGEVFLDIIHNSKTEPFQWIDLGDLVAQFKVTLREPSFQNEARESEANKILHITLKEYRRSPANDETYVERFGLNI